MSHSQNPGIVARLENAAWAYLAIESPPFGTMKQIAAQYDVSPMSLSRRVGRIRANLQPALPQKYRNLFLVVPKEYC